MSVRQSISSTAGPTSAELGAVEESVLGISQELMWSKSPPFQTPMVELFKELALGQCGIALNATLQHPVIFQGQRDTPLPQVGQGLEP